MHISGWGAQGSGIDILFRSHSVLPATNPLLCSSLSLWGSFSVPADLPTVRAFPGHRSSPFFSSFPGVQVLFCFLFSLFEKVVLSSYIVMFRASLSFQVFEVFCLCSVRVVPVVDIFLIFLWEEVSSKSYYSAILILYTEYVKEHKW